MEVSAKMQTTYPQFQRDMGALVLPYIQKLGGIELQNSISFANDSLFCEWGYVVDYDKNTFEVYKGFIKHAHSGRFSNGKSNGDGYYPIEIAKSFDMNNLPTGAEFLECLGEKE